MLSESIDAVAHGSTHSWVGGHELVLEKLENLADGSLRDRAVIGEPHSVTDLVQVDANRLAIQVANTLINHCSVGIAIPYDFSHQTRSSQFGPVRLIHE